MNRILRTVTTVATVVPLVACLNAHQGISKANEPTEELRVFVTQNCPLTQAAYKPAEGFFAVLLSAVLPGLIDKALAFSGSALREAGKESSVSFERAETAHFYSYSLADEYDPKQPIKLRLDIRNQIQCISIVKAVFTGATNFKTASATEKSRLDKLGVKQDPSFYAEYLIETSRDRIAFKLDPKKILYRGNLENSDRKEKRSLVITTSFSKPGETQPFAVFASSLKDATPREEEFPLGPAKTRWMKLPSLSEDNEALVTRTNESAMRRNQLLRGPSASEQKLTQAKQQLANLQYGALKDAISKKTFEIGQIEAQIAAEKQSAANAVLLAQTKWGSDLIEPINITVHIDETKDANKLLLFLADVFDGSQAGIKDALVKNLDPAQREALKKQKADAAVTAADLDATKQNAAVSAYYDFKLAETKYFETEARAGATMTERLSAQRDMELAKLRMQQAYARIGQSPPL